MEDPYGHFRSIARLRDDELSCVLPFLALPDLAELVRCSRRLNGVARKERSRGLLRSIWASTVPYLLSSALGQHVTSLKLNRRHIAESAVTRATLAQLRSLPQLTALELELRSNDDIAALMQRLTFENAVAALQSVLPPQLRSFSLALGATVWLDAPTRLLFSSIFSAVTVMPQLTELDIRSWSYGMPLDARFDALAQLPQSRKLSLYGLGNVDWTNEQLAEFKQLSQLRDLCIVLSRDNLFRLCQPPHSLQLEHIDLCNILVDESVMRALLHLPTLTELAPACFLSAAWPLLPQLLLLRRLTVNYFPGLSDVRATLLTTALTGCRALTELSLGNVVFVDREDTTNEQQQARWAEILRSVPLLQRFKVDTRQALSLLDVLPVHLPQLVHLELRTSAAVSEVVARLAHPTVQELELVRPSSGPLDASQLRELVGNPRVPCLVRCTCSVS
jgi:hypothetical protein